MAEFEKVNRKITDIRTTLEKNLKQTENKSDFAKWKTVKFK